LSIGSIRSGRTYMMSYDPLVIANEVKMF
jgi:hypothetical protein